MSLQTLKTVGKKAVVIFTKWCLSNNSILAPWVGCFSKNLNNPQQQQHQQHECVWFYCTLVGLCLWWTNSYNMNLTEQKVQNSKPQWIWPNKNLKNKIEFSIFFLFYSLHTYYLYFSFWKKRTKGLKWWVFILFIYLLYFLLHFYFFFYIFCSCGK